MREWRGSTIGAEATLQRGFDITKDAQRPGGVPVISSGGVASYHDTPAATGPGVVLGRKGVVGSVWFVESDYWPHDTTLWVKDFHGNDPRFVYYFFRWFAPLLASLDVGSANPTLNRNHVHPTPVRWPPLAQQRRIAEVLGALDDKIELNRRMSETLEATARALFKSWFVDREHPEAEVGKPWADGTLAEFAELNPEVWTSRNKPALLHYIDLAGTKWGRIGAATVFETSEAPSRAQRVLRPGDTIVGTVRPGNGSYALVARAGLTGSTGFAQLRPKVLRDAAFVYVAATARENIEALAHVADGGAYPAVRPNVVAETPVVRPDRQTLEAFSAAATPLLNRAASAAEESATLAATRDVLLPRLLSGDLIPGDAIVSGLAVS